MSDDSLWVKTPIEQLRLNPFEMIDKDWMLVTAGNMLMHNTMTASWGGFGVFWKKPCSMIFVRPSRYTMGFIEQQDYYSLCFFSKIYKRDLAFCGAHSGRDIDKDKHTGLIARFDQEAPYYEQASHVFICRKICATTLDENSFLDFDLAEENYPLRGDYHKMYIGEITTVLTKKFN